MMERQPGAKAVVRRDLKRPHPAAVPVRDVHEVFVGAHSQARNPTYVLAGGGLKRDPPFLVLADRRNALRRRFREINNAFTRHRKRTWVHASQNHLLARTIY